jgi:thiol:disulfide interchange protein DsbD
MMLERALIFAFAVFTALIVAPSAQAGSSATLDHVRLDATLEAPLQPGKTVWVAIHQHMDPGWHTYWRNPGEAGVATSITWSLPQGVTAGDIRWPTPERFSDGTVTNYGYEKDTTLLVPLAASTTAKSGIAHLTVNLLACEHMCIPEQATLDLDLGKASGTAAMFDAARRAIPQPFAGTARFSLDARSVRVVLDLPQDPAADAVAVFPAEQRLMADGGVARVRVDGSRVTWTMPAQAGAKAPASFSGVVAVAGQGAWAFTAQPGLTAAPPTNAAHDNGLLVALALAFLGGLILNLMPCVLPVLSMKALALARTGSDSAAAKREGLFYLAGVMATFAIMAVVLLTLKASGAALGWGFQLQSPVVVLGLALLMATIGMNLFGVFELPLGFAGAGDHLAQSGGAKGAFFTGALAVVVASPCTAPFMGAALGFALTQPILAAASVFLALGLGFAAPFTIISFSPALVRLLPKPGNWMNTFKQAMAFPMFATAIWLLWVLARQSGTDAVIIGLAVGLGIALLVWLCRITRGLWSWAVGIAGAVALTISSALALIPPAPSSQPMWQPWSEQALASARQTGRPVLVDFSAAWCVTCLVNERVALNDAAVMKRLKEGRVVTLKGDWTNPDPAITAALHQFGRDGVPLYVLYTPSGKTEVLPQILTPQIVLAALTDDGAAVQPR